MAVFTTQVSIHQNKQAENLSMTILRTSIRNYINTLACETVIIKETQTHVCYLDSYFSHVISLHHWKCSTIISDFCQLSKVERNKDEKALRQIYVGNEH